jgi:DnaJ-domain-containing protein 1
MMNSSRLLCLYLLMATLLPVSGRSEDFRAWFSQKGSTINARFVIISKSCVILQKVDGSFVKIEYTALSNTDQVYLSQNLQAEDRLKSRFDGIPVKSRFYGIEESEPEDHVERKSRFSDSIYNENTLKRSRFGDRLAEEFTPPEPNDRFEPVPPDDRFEFSEPDDSEFVFSKPQLSESTLAAFLGAVKQTVIDALNRVRSVTPAPHPETSGSTVLEPERKTSGYTILEPEQPSKFSSMTDSELENIASQGRDLSAVSDVELKRIASQGRDLSAQSTLKQIVAIVFGCLFFLLIFVAIYRRGKRRQRETEHQEAERRAKEEHLRDERERQRQENERRRQEESSQRKAEEERRQREAEARRAAEEERRRSEENRRGSSQRKPVKDERYYGSILGLKGQVRPTDVKRRYRELVAQYHPDKVNHLGPKLRKLAESEMKAINEAYDFFRRTYNL